MQDDALVFSKVPDSPEGSAQEAQHLREVEGPGIVALQGLGDDGELLLARAACSLADVLVERGPLPESEVRAVAAAAAAALARVHEAGLVHGDVKPANLLLSHDGELWLADFDAAVPADGRPLERYSPGRAPPGAVAETAGDIAALALTLVELSTGARLDPCVPWRAAELRRLRCPPALSAEIAFMLGRDGSTLSAPDAAEMFRRGGTGALPTPAVKVRRVDPTPTVEFMPAHPPPSDTSAAPAPAAAERQSRWWQRLAASWRQD